VEAADVVVVVAAAAVASAERRAVAAVLHAQVRRAPALLGSFVWYRPGLCQCRFRMGPIAPL
jgi:hypothetical protein